MRIQLLNNLLQFCAVTVRLQFKIILTRKEHILNIINWLLGKPLMSTWHKDSLSRVQVFGSHLPSYKFHAYYGINLLLHLAV
jgi:hypothetical protein